MAFYTALHPRRLVITGAPGSGKAVLAIELVLGLKETRAPDDPVPVRLAAASWSTRPDAGGMMPVEDWLVTQLTSAYDLSAASARTLVTAQKVLPVIDGLDEMDADVVPGTSRSDR